MWPATAADAVDHGLDIVLQIARLTEDGRAVFLRRPNVRASARRSAWSEPSQRPWRCLPSRCSAYPLGYRIDGRAAAWIASTSQGVDHRLRDEAHTVGGPAEPACIRFSVVADHEPVRNRHAAVDDDLCEPRRAADGHVRQRDHVGETGIRVVPDTGEQQRLVDPRTGNDAAARNQGTRRRAASRVFVVDEFGRRRDLAISPDRPFTVIQIERRDEIRQVDVGFPERVDGAGVAPVGLGLRPAADAAVGERCATALPWLTIAGMISLPKS